LLQGLTGMKPPGTQPSTTTLPGAILPGVVDTAFTNTQIFSAARIEIKPLDSETTRVLRESGGNLKVDKLANYLSRFRGRVSTRHRAVRILLSMS
jgi:hypothetical protein